MSSPLKKARIVDASQEIKDQLRILGNGIPFDRINNPLFDEFHRNRGKNFLWKNFFYFFFIFILRYFIFARIPSLCRFSVLKSNLKNTGQGFVQKSESNWFNGDLRSHAPRRPVVLLQKESKLVNSLSDSEFQLALSNALRYFPQEFHSKLAPEFAQELVQSFSVLFALLLLLLF